MPSTPSLPASDAAPAAAHAPHDPDTQAGAAVKAVAPCAAERPDVAVATAQDCAQRLAQLWPALFAGAARPIKLRIQKDIQERSPGVFSRAVLSAFLHRYTGSGAYLRAIARGGQRFDLDGQAAGEISDEHRKAAAEEIERRRARRVERDELELARRRNRAALLHDFERTTLTRANFCALKGVAEDELDALLAIARDEAAQAPPQPSARPRRPEARRAPDTDPRRRQRR